MVLLRFLINIYLVMGLSIEGFPRAVSKPCNREILRKLKDMGVCEMFIPVQDSSVVTSGAVSDAISALQDVDIKPVPHIPVRKLSIRDAFGYADMLEQKEVEKALIIGGDTPYAVGRLDSSLELARQLGDISNYLKTIVFALHPEGHPVLSDFELDSALKEKEIYANGISKFSVEYVTQMLFSAKKAKNWLATHQIERPVSLSFSIPTSPLEKLRHAQILRMRLKSVAWGAFKSLSGDCESDRVMEIIMENSQQFSPHIFAFGGLTGIEKFIANSHVLGQY